MTRYTRFARAWSVLSLVLQCAAIGLSAQFVTSCRTLRTSASSELQADSMVSYVESVTFHASTTPVPRDSVGLRISLTSLRELPAGAEYSAKRGRTRVSVGLTGGGDTVAICAETDSLPRESLASARFVQRSSHVRHEESNVSEKSRRSPSVFGSGGILFPAVLFFAGLACLFFSLWKLK